MDVNKKKKKEKKKEKKRHAIFADSLSSQTIVSNVLLPRPILYRLLYIFSQFWKFNFVLVWFATWASVWLQSSLTRRRTMLAWLEMLCPFVASCSVRHHQSCSSISPPTVILEWIQFYSLTFSFSFFCLALCTNFLAHTHTHTHTHTLTHSLTLVWFEIIHLLVQLSFLFASAIHCTTI